MLSHPQDGVSLHPTVRYVFVEVFIMPVPYNPNTAAGPSLVFFKLDRNPVSRLFL